MGLVGNALGLVGFSWGNVASKLARPLLGAAGAEMLGIAIDLSRGNIGGVVKNSMDLMEALSGKKAGCAGAHSCDRPSGILGTIAKAGFTAAAVLGGGALVGSMLGGTALGGLAKMMLGAMGLMAAFKGGCALLGGAAAMAGGGGIGGFLAGALGPGGPFQGETILRNKMGATYTNGGPGSLVNRLPPNATFEDLVAAFMIDAVKDMQDEAKAKMDEIRQSIDKGDGKSASSGIGGFFGGLASKLPVVGRFFGSQQNSGKGEDSRNLMFEELKNIMQKLAQMQQAMSNVLNTMHEQAMGAIRHIKS